MSRRTNTKQAGGAGAVPGNSLQQMWHVLNFHEQRLLQTANLYQEMESKQMGAMTAQQQTIARMAQVLRRLEKKMKTLETDLSAMRAANAAMATMSITVDEDEDEEEEEESAEL